jgi:hypothetical protein
MKIETDIPHRTTSYQRLVEKLKRNPSERADTKDWPRPNTPKEVIQHAIKGAISKTIKIDFKGIKFFLTTQLGAFVLAYGVRATVNFCLYLIRILRGK